MVGGEVADPGLEGGQVAVLRPHVAVCWPRNDHIILLSKGEGYSTIVLSITDVLYMVLQLP